TTTAFRSAYRLSTELGPPSAEYEAMIYGLAQVAIYVATHSPAVTAAVLYSDSRVVIDTLTMRKGAGGLAPMRERARNLQGCIEAQGIDVHYEWVPRKDKRHVHAHELAAEARRFPAEITARPFPPIRLLPSGAAPQRGR